MVNPNSGGGRLRSDPDPLAQVRSEQRRVLDRDINQLRDNNRSLKTLAGATNLKNVSSSTELNRQMKREVLKHKGIASPKAFRQVAARMHMSGYSEQSIMRGMRHYNRQMSQMKGHEFRNYFNRNIKPALRHPKVQRARTQNEAFKRQHGIPQTYKNMQGLQKINQHVQKKQRQQAQARQQQEQRAIAQNRKQGIQQSHTRGRR